MRSDNSIKKLLICGENRIYIRKGTFEMFIERKQNEFIIKRSSPKLVATVPMTLSLFGSCGRIKGNTWPISEKDVT